MGHFQSLFRRMSSVTKQFWSKLDQFDIVFIAEGQSHTNKIVSDEILKLTQSALVIDLSSLDNYNQVKQEIESKTGTRPTLSRVFFKGQFIGTSDDFLQLLSKKMISSYFNGCIVKSRANVSPLPAYDYDLVVIGGGSGGLAAAKEAAKYESKKIALFDFVDPSNQGTTWGIGGTCTNVGCIPKIMNHRAASLGISLKHSVEYGWNINPHAEHNWSTLKDSVNGYIGSVNFKDRTSLRKVGVTYLNMKAKFVDHHTIMGTDKSGKTKQITAANVLVATGGRPQITQIPGALEYAITSDDLFKLDKSPGKTLIIGASFIALECAGFLNGLKHDVTVMVRSILLRGFDQQMANLVGDALLAEGVSFRRTEIPLAITKDGTDHPLKVRSVNTESKEEFVGEYDTVMFAIGRYPNTGKIGISEIGVDLDKSGKIYTNTRDETNIPNIYALGDCASGKPELTPFAIQAGRMFARRLFSESDELCDYSTIPLTVFTPTEFGTVGMAEESAVEIFGSENVEVYHNKFIPSDYSFLEEDPVECYLKIICLKTDNERVVGMHYAGPNAGEVIQGFAVAMRLGLTKRQLDDSVGIHPTCAENFTTLTTTKSSGEEIGEGGC